MKTNLSHFATLNFSKFPSLHSSMCHLLNLTASEVDI